MEDWVKGGVTLAVAIVLFVYVSTWLLVTPLLEGNPFVSDDLPLLVIFPPREWAIGACAVVGERYRENRRAARRPTTYLSCHRYVQLCRFRKN
jgi:hypothetical protein